MNWRDYWNQDTPIYSGERHKLLHYRLVARDMSALIPGPDAAILDHGCGEALFAGELVRRCGQLTLCDGAPLIRDRLRERYRTQAGIAVVSPEELLEQADVAFDIIIVNSLLQYLSLESLRDLLAAWRTRLKPGGRLVLADVIPPDVGPLEDARALLRFAWQGGFLISAILSLARTALSDYRKVRDEIGLSAYSESEMREILWESGFKVRRLERNIGHNQARMAFEAWPV